MIPWVEKYRPNRVEDVAHQDQVVNTLKSSIESGNVPHLLFYGTPGTGKTTVALALAKQFYGSYFKERTLELNASDERGIKVVREKIKNFANKSVPTRKINGKTIAPFKMIILDEADSMTRDAQSALRRTIEVYTNVTRFCLICNYVSKIIEPIASRCAKFRFQPLTANVMKTRFKYICEQESLTYEDEAFDELISVSEGDMRRAITLLQSTAECNEKKIQKLVIEEISGKIPNKYSEKVFEIFDLNKFKELELFVDEFIKEGFSVDMFLNKLFEGVLKCNKLNDTKKSTMFLKLSEIDMNLTKGADSELQLLALLSDMFRVYQM